MTRRGLLLFIGLGVVWGIPYLLIKIAIEEIEPAMLVLARTAIAAAILLPIAAARHELRRLLRYWKPLVGYTVAEIVFPWFFLNTAEQRLPSSTTGLLLASIPLVSVGVGFLLGRRDRLGWANWLGIAVGMLGVAAIVGLDVAGTDLASVALLLIVAAGYALGPAIIAKWMPDAPGVGVAAVSLGLAALVYLPIVATTNAWPVAVPSLPVIGSVLALALFCSAAAFVMMVWLIAEIGPMRATAITYINPAVAVLAGVLFLGEPITVWTVVGFALVLAGSWLVTRRVTPRAADAPLAATALTTAGNAETPGMKPSVSACCDPSGI